MELLNEELHDYRLEIKDLIINKVDNLEVDLEEYHLFDISRVVSELEPEQITELFSTISADFSASIFEYLE